MTMPAAKTKTMLTPGEAIASVREKITAREREDIRSALDDYRQLIDRSARGLSLNDAAADRLYEAMQILHVGEAEIAVHVDVHRRVLDNGDIENDAKCNALAEQLGADEAAKRAAVPAARAVLAAAEEALRQAEIANSQWTASKRVRRKSRSSAAASPIACWPI
jgi:hypothetical protein